MKKITVHTLVKNEGRYLWFSIISVINYVDQVLLWDTGSNDETREIMKEIKRLYPDKIKINFLSGVDIYEFAKVRQQMLDETKTDWFMVVDGDEVWWEESIRKLVETIDNEGDQLESIVVPTINLVGDIFHYQEEAAGNYHLAGRRGHLNLRAINKSIPGLHSDNPHGTWGWVDGENKMIQDRAKEKVKFIDAPYLHATFLRRAGKEGLDEKVPKRKNKLKHEIGASFPEDFYYPEAFFKVKPTFIESPWEVMDLKFKLIAYWQTPLRKIKRRLLPRKVGY